MREAMDADSSFRVCERLAISQCWVLLYTHVFATCFHMMLALNVYQSMFIDPSSYTTQMRLC